MGASLDAGAEVSLVAGVAAWVDCEGEIETSASIAWAIVPESSSPRVTVTTLAWTPDMLFTTASASVFSTSQEC